MDVLRRLLLRSVFSASMFVISTTCVQASSLPWRSGFVSLPVQKIMQQATRGTTCIFKNSLWTSARYCSTDHSKHVSIGNPCIDAVFQYGLQDPFITSQFLNAVLDLKDDRSIQDVSFLPRDLPPSDPLAPLGYHFTVDVRCKTKDGQHFLVEMQNDFRDDYHLKALVEHARMLSRIDFEQFMGKDFGVGQSTNTGSASKFWKGIQGVYSIVLTNKVFYKTKMKTAYPKELLMEPKLVNPYELRHVHQLERHYGNVPNQIILLMLANLPNKPAKDYSYVERWAYLFRDETLKSGVHKISETKEIDNPDEISGGDKAIQEFIDRLDMRHLPMDVRTRYLSAIQYYNDSIVDIDEKAEERGVSKGKIEEKQEIAKKMLDQNLPIGVIVTCTGLTENEISNRSPCMVKS